MKIDQPPPFTSFRYLRGRHLLQAVLPDLLALLGDLAEAVRLLLKAVLGPALGRHLDRVLGHAEERRGGARGGDRDAGQGREDGREDGDEPEEALLEVPAHDEVAGLLVVGERVGARGEPHDGVVALLLLLPLVVVLVAVDVRDLVVVEQEVVDAAVLVAVGQRCGVGVALVQVAQPALALVVAPLDELVDELLVGEDAVVYVGLLVPGGELLTLGPVLEHVSRVVFQEGFIEVFTGELLGKFSSHCDTGNKREASTHESLLDAVLVVFSLLLEVVPLLLHVCLLLGILLLLELDLLGLLHLLVFVLLFFLLLILVLLGLLLFRDTLGPVLVGLLALGARDALGAILFVLDGPRAALFAALVTLWSISNSGRDALLTPLAGARPMRRENMSMEANLALTSGSDFTAGSTSPDGAPRVDGGLRYIVRNHGRGYMIDDDEDRLERARHPHLDGLLSSAD
ncbi:hypothetical protein PG989_003035 [Apiospora arundinis]